MTTMETETDIVAGTRYRVNVNNPEGATLPTGATVQAVQTDRGIRFQQINQHDQPEGREWIIYPRHLDSLAETVTLEEAFIPVTVSREDHDTIVASLQEQAAVALRERDEALADARTMRERSLAFRTQVANDATTASAILIEEADRRDWCGDYDAIITRINGRITAFQFDDRVISYNASRRVEVTVSFWVTQSGSYEGRGEPDEDDVDWNEVDNYEVHEVLRSLTRGDYDFQVDDDTTQDFETEVSES